MKRKDISIIFLIAVFSAVVSVILSGMFFSTPKDRRQKIEVVEIISTNFERPDSTYFNNSSINPAQTIQVGQDPDSNPFEDR